jgi:hypothetical protein
MSPLKRTQSALHWKQAAFTLHDMLSDWGDKVLGYYGATSGVWQACAHVGNGNWGQAEPSQLQWNSAIGRTESECDVQPGVIYTAGNKLVKGFVSPLYEAARTLLRLRKVCGRAAPWPSSAAVRISASFIR